MPSKTAVSILAVVAMLQAVGTLEAQGGQKSGRGPQGRWLFTDSSREKSPLAADPKEEKLLKLLEEIAESEKSSLLVPLADARLLRTLTESTGAKNVVEIGTYTGYSTLWFCLALRNTGGKITTHEIDPRNAAVARDNVKKAGMERLVTIVEGDAHETVKRLKEPIDILFIDADKEGYADYLRKLVPLVRPGGLILAHNTTDIRLTPDYFTAVNTDPNLDSIFLGKPSEGMGITLKKHR